MKKKLVYILHSLQMGGVEVALLSAIPDLNTTFDLRIICLGPVDGNLLKNLSQEERSKIHAFDYTARKWLFLIPKVQDFILSFDPDVVISSLWRAHWIAQSLKRKAPQIVYIPFFHSAQFAHFLDAYFGRKVLNRANTVFVDSQSTDNFISGVNRTIKAQKISLLTHLNPVQNPNQGLDPSDTIKFMFLGRINKVKNLTQAIILIKRLSDNGLSIQFDIYGSDDGDLTACQKVVQELNLETIVTFKGPLDVVKKFQVFKEYHFYLQLSQYEGMAMSVAEAMQYGLPCIVNPVGEIPNYASDLVSAIFIAPSNLEDGLNKVLKVIESESDYNLLSQNAFKAFTNQKTYSQSLIEGILNETSKK